MSKVINKFNSMVKGALGVLGVRLIDPIEVYYLPEQNTFYPIISKSACSSIKLMLIRKFKPGYEAEFPAIHQLDPAPLTGNKLERIFFFKKSKYARWTANKKMVFIMREPISRLYSCYLDVKVGKNTMYSDPAEIQWLVKFRKGISFESFLKKVCAISDPLSDRHFRSQSFFLNNGIQNSLAKLETLTLPAFMEIQKSKNSNAQSERAHLNTNSASISAELRSRLEQNSDFNTRYSADIHLYTAIANSE